MGKLTRTLAERNRSPTNYSSRPRIEFRRGFKNVKPLKPIKVSISITDEAQQDLDQIAEWDIEHHPGGRERFIKDFDMALTVLARFPFAGRERFKHIGLRGYPVYPYLLVYRVDERAKEVVAL